MSVISVNECLHYEESDSIISKLLGAQDLPSTHTQMHEVGDSFMVGYLINMIRDRKLLKLLETVSTEKSCLFCLKMVI